MSISDSVIHVTLPDLLVAILWEDGIQTLSLTAREPDGHIVLLLWRKDERVRVERMLKDDSSDLETMKAAPLEVFPFVETILKIREHADTFPKAILPDAIIDLLEILKP